MKFLLKKKKLIAIPLVCLILFLHIVLLLPLNKAKAVVPVLDSPNLARNTITSVNTGTLVTKEYVKDPIAYAIAKTAIHGITNSIVNWINSGFQGNPAFITDLRGFLLDLADAQTANFIEGTALELLCSPWRTNIKIALSLPSAGFREDVRCTLSDIVANMDDFINGDFSQGGWAGWIELTTVPQNNPYGAYLMASAELDRRISSTQAEEMKLLDWGNGFLSYKKCEEGQQPTTPGGGPGAPVNCKIVTPGSVIESQLANVLGSGVRQLELADEFNEIVSALLNQLIEQAMGGLGGLRGASQSLYGRSPLTSQIGNSSSGASLSEIKQYAVVGLKSDINNETDYKSVKQGTLNSVIASENLLSHLQVCYAGKLTNNLSSENKLIAQQRINNAGSTVVDKITPIKTSLENDIKIVDKNIEKLRNLLKEINNASNKEKANELTNDLVLIRMNGELNTSDIYNAYTEQATVISQMSSLDNTTNTQIAECQAFPPPPENEQNL